MTSLTPGCWRQCNADWRGPAGLKHRQGQRLRLEIIKKQALVQPQFSGDGGAVDRPGRIGQLDAAPGNRAGRAGDEGARPDAEGLESRRQRGLEACMRRGLARQARQQRRIGAHLQREAGVGAADIAKNNGERKVQAISLLRGAASNKRKRRLRRKRAARRTASSLTARLQLSCSRSPWRSPLESRPLTPKMGDAHVTRLPEMTFQYHSPFPLRKDETPFRKLDCGGVRLETFGSREFLVVEREAIRAAERSGDDRHQPSAAPRPSRAARAKSSMTRRPPQRQIRRLRSLEERQYRRRRRCCRCARTPAPPSSWARRAGSSSPRATTQRPRRRHSRRL